MNSKLIEDNNDEELDIVIQMPDQKQWFQMNQGAEVVELANTDQAKQLVAEINKWIESQEQNQ